MVFWELIASQPFSTHPPTYHVGIYQSLSLIFQRHDEIFPGEFFVASFILKVIMASKENFYCSIVVEDNTMAAEEYGQNFVSNNELPHT